ncbi:MAG: hypothetical protein BMS9Abin05_1793 [Rhodothermia bacterium]|nr:MAG: hypothetical protein BMS9Abin05_1793 [Rhodothermia bacterium]
MINQYSGLKTSPSRFPRLAILIVFVVFLAGCDSQGDNDDDGTPPQILSADIFSLQVDLFRQGATKGSGSKLNFAAAAFRVWPVSLVLSAHTIIPVAVTAAALNDTPEFVDGAWEWTATVPVQQSSIDFTLIGAASGSTVDWRMEISGTDPVSGVTYDSFVLYTAQTTVGEQGGSWKLYYELEGVRTNVLDATFDVTDDDTKSLTYSVPVTFPDTGGDSVLFDTDGNAKHFLWQQVNLSRSHEVEWDAATKEGSIVSTTFNSGDKGCWDTNLDDIECK